MKSKTHMKSLEVGCMAAVIFCIFTFVIQVSPSKADEPIIWKATSAYAAGLSYHQHAEYFAQRVKELSNGRLIIQMNTGGSIVPVFSEQEAVNRGAIDLSCSSSMYIRGKFPAGVLFGTAMFGFRIQDAMAWFEYGGGYALWQEMYDKVGWNVKVLPCFCSAGTESMGWYRKPIRKIEDFKGMKYRTVGEWGEVIQKMGGSVISLPSGELYSALEKGVVDGVDMTHPSFDRGLALYEVCKFNIYPGVHQTCTPMETLVNKDKWEALPDDLKQIVIAAAREATFRSMTKTIVEDAEAVEFFESKGVEIIRLSPEAIATIKVHVDEVLAAHAAKDPFYDKILKSQTAFYSKWKKYDALVKSRRSNQTWL